MGSCLLNSFKSIYTQDLEVVSPIIGALVVASLLNCFTYLGLFLHVYQWIAILLLIAGVINIFIILKKNRLLDLFPAEINFYKILTLLILTFLCIASLGPVTNADSLDYHIGVPLYLINYGCLPKTCEWLHGQLAGSGELLNAIGLAVSAESFGSLLQFTALASFVLFVYRLATKDDNEKATILALFLVASPVLVFFTTAQKPQLLPQTATAIALWLVASDNKKTDEDKFILICILVMGAAQQKLSFYITGGIIGSYALIKSYRYYGIRPVLIALGMSIIFFGPRMYWYFTENGGILSEVHILSLPFEFIDKLRNHRENFCFFPLNLIIPDSLGKITAIIGIPILFPLVIKRLNPKVIGTLVLTTVALLLTILFGQFTARFFFEFILWGSVLFLFLPKQAIRLNIFKWSVLLQSLIMVLLSVYAALTLGPGGFSRDIRETIMEQSANGYTVAKWADNVLPDDAVILSGIRSIALMPRKSVPTDWINNVQDTDRLSGYLHVIEQRGVTHVILRGKDPKGWICKNCLGERVAGPKQFFVGTRNPFNRQPYFASIYKFNNNQFREFLTTKHK